MEDVESLRHILERDHHLYIVRLKSSKCNGRPKVFITFHSDRDAEIAVQQLDGQMLFGSRLNVTLDNQPRWIGFPSGNSCGGATQKPSPSKIAISGKSSEKVKVKSEAVVKPVRRGPVIIDGSKD